MTLDETIQRLEEDVIMYKHYEHEMKNRGWGIESVMCKEGADERQQLAEWLKELKRLREQTDVPDINVGKLDGDPVDIDKAVEHYEETLGVLKGVGLEVNG